MRKAELIILQMICAAMFTGYVKLKLMILLCFQNSAKLAIMLFYIATIREAIKKKSPEVGTLSQQGGGLTGGVGCPNLLIWLFFMEGQNLICVKKL
jgi:hypothetical protein